MDWLKKEIVAGFQKLSCLGLDREPASDMITGTAMAWFEAISAGRDWQQERDTPRIRRAFVVLSTTRETWPAPRHFLDALPRMEMRQLAEPDRKPASPEVVAKAMAELRAWIAEVDAAPKVTKPEPPKADGPPLSEVERELAQHYADRKSAAAGDA